jgi:mycoredoxin
MTPANTAQNPLPIGHEAIGHPARHAITVYGTDWCGDTRRVRAHLDALGLEYNYYNTDLDPAMARTAAALQNGGTKIPVVDLHNGTVLVEPTNLELADALQHTDGLPHVTATSV